MVGSVNLPRQEKREAERRKAHLGNSRGLFPGSPENRGTRQRLSTFRRGDLLASARSSKAQEASASPPITTDFPPSPAPRPAISWQAPIVGPGGVPRPPECK